MPTVFITGANRGLGLEFARQYAADGWRVHATVRSEEKIYDLQEVGGDVRIHILDMADSGSIRRAAEKLSGEAIDVLVANAGMYGPSGPLGKLDAEGWAKTLATNAVGPTLLAEAFAEYVARSEMRKMVAVSSKMGSIADNGSGGSYAYRSSKAALNAAWKSLSVDLRERGITVAVLHPGWVRTDMGGPNGLIDPPESVAGMREVIEALTDENSGEFFDYKGQRIAW